MKNRSRIESQADINHTHVLSKVQVLISIVIIQVLILLLMWAWRTYGESILGPGPSLKQSLIAGLPLAILLAILMEIWSTAQAALKSSTNNSKAIKLNSETSSENSKRLRKIELENKVTKPLQEMVLGMQRHQDTMESLIRDFMDQKRRHIPNARRSLYWDRLQEAISKSERYYGIKHGTIDEMNNDDYKKGEGHIYLIALKQKEMIEKIRVFVVNDEDSGEMTDIIYEDRNGAVTNYFYLNGDVETYWITVKELRKEAFLHRIPKDCGIYDEEIQIEYVSEGETDKTASSSQSRSGYLVFSQVDKITDPSPEYRVFAELNQLKKSGSIGDFKRIWPTNDKTGAT